MMKCQSVRESDIVLLNFRDVRRKYFNTRRKRPCQRNQQESQRIRTIQHFILWVMRGDASTILLRTKQSHEIDRQQCTVAEKQLTADASVSESDSTETRTAYPRARETRLRS